MLGIATLLWALRSAYALLFHVYLWQLKEYRLDRVLAHLSTRKGKEPLYNPLGLAKLVLVLLLLGLPTSIPLVAQVGVVIGLYFIEVLRQVTEAVQRRMRRPVPTLKSLSILVSTGMIGLCLALVVPIVWNLLSPLGGNPTLFLVFLIALDRIIWAIVAVTSLAYGPATAFAKARVIQLAIAKRQRLGDLRVVGITGSFGKTSTKEFLSAILSTRYAVAETHGNTNTAIGVARSLRDSVRTEDQVFVVEMGAYEPGEISQICDIVHPDIAVVTSIEDQHLALFGSLENVVRGKLELVDSLPPSGLAVLNLDSTAIAQNLSAVKSRRCLYSLHQHADLVARSVVVRPEALDFIVEYGGVVEQFHTHLLGEQNVPNILAATAVAIELGVSLREVSTAAPHFEPLKRTMFPLRQPNGALFVDDTYSASSGAVMAALGYLEKLENVRKVLVFSEIIELGSRAQEVHYKIGVRIGEVCDLAIVTSRNYARTVVAGSRDAGAPECRVVFTEDLVRAAEMIEEVLSPDSVVVFEGRGPEHILYRLQDNPRQSRTEYHEQP